MVVFTSILDINIIDTSIVIIFAKKGMLVFSILNSTKHKNATITIKIIILVFLYKKVIFVFRKSICYLRKTKTTYIIYLVNKYYAVCY